MCSGVVPQLSVILGPSAGGAVYSPAITDFIFMVDGISQMYITGPDVIKAVSGEEVSHQDLGGAEPHTSRSGVAHFRYSSEDECLFQVRRLLGFLPSNNMSDMPRAYTADDPNRVSVELRSLIPEEPNKPYDNP